MGGSFIGWMAHPSDNALVDNQIRGGVVCFPLISAGTRPIDIVRGVLGNLIVIVGSYIASLVHHEPYMIATAISAVIQSDEIAS